MINKAPKPNLLLLFLFFCSGTAVAQKSTAGTWEIQGTSAVFGYSNINPRAGYGLTADYYITDNLSVKGGFLAGPDYFTISTAPLFWALFCSTPTDADRTYNNLPDDRHAFKIIFLLAFLSDGFAYNIKASESLYISPYVAPLQYHSLAPDCANQPYRDLLTSAAGLNIKKYITKKFVVTAGAELCTTFLFDDTRWGYRVNASIGYVFPGQ